MTSSTHSWVGFEAGEVVWNLLDEFPGLVTYAPEAVDKLLRGIVSSGAVPVARIAAPFERDNYFRPTGHVRAFYQTIEENEECDRSVVGFKGSEVWSDDLEQIVEAMAEGRSSLNGNDFFVLLETKAPVAYLLHEALSDAQKAAVLFEAVASGFHYHPRLPLPLCVVKWPDVATERYKNSVMPHLSATTRGVVSRLLTDGLAEYVYYYRGQPHRLRSRTASANTETTPDWNLVESWADLFAQILISGYVPATLSNQKWGCCVQDQNVCMDGGFVDVDSVERIDDDPAMFAANLLGSVQMLAHSIAQYLHPFVPTDIADRDLLLMGNAFGTRLNPTFVLPHVWNLVAGRVQKHSDDGSELPVQVSSVFSERDPLKTLWHLSQQLNVLGTNAASPLQDHVVICSTSHT